MNLWCSPISRGLIIPVLLFGVVFGVCEDTPDRSRAIDLYFTGRDVFDLQRYA